MIMIKKYIKHHDCKVLKALSLFYNSKNNCNNFTNYDIYIFFLYLSASLHNTCRFKLLFLSQRIIVTHRHVDGVTLSCVIVHVFSVSADLQCRQLLKL